MAYKSQKEELRKKYGSICMLCERKLQKKQCTFHHKIPKSILHIDNISNGCILCEECQRIIHTFIYGTEAYTILTEKINKNESKYFH